MPCQSIGGGSRGTGRAIRGCVGCGFPRFPVSVAGRKASERHPGVRVAGSDAERPVGVGSASAFGPVAICGRAESIRRGGAVRNAFRFPVRRPLLLRRIVFDHAERDATTARVFRHASVRRPSRSGKRPERQRRTSAPEGALHGRLRRYGAECDRRMNAKCIVVIFLSSGAAATDFFVSLLRAASGKDAVR